MSTITDQIKDLENTRAAKAQRMEDVLQKAIDEGRSTDAAEAEEYDELVSEIKQIDEDLSRYNNLLKMQAQKATPVAEPSQAPETVSRGPTILVKPKDVDESFQGQNFTRMAIAKAIAKKDNMNPVDVAAMRWGKTNPTLVEVMKANVAGHGSGTGEAGAELVSADNRYTGDFIEFLHDKTVYNQLPLREVPANVTIKGHDGAATGYWVGESAAIPATVTSMSTVSLTPLKVAAITVLSNELIRDSSPSAEMLIRDALVASTAERIDTTFISTTAASAGVSPAGILWDVAATSSAGTDIDGIINDIKELKQRFIDNKNTGGLWWVMNPALASSLGLLRNALGQKEFTEINEMGGMLEGNPVVVGDNVNASWLVLCKPSEIWRIGMGGIEVSISEQATIEMGTAPTGDSENPTAQSENPVGMFQTESTAIKVVQSINFAKRRTHAAQYISDASYGGSVST